MICILKTTKGHKSVNNVGAVRVLCTLSGIFFIFVPSFVKIYFTDLQHYSSYFLHIV